MLGPSYGPLRRMCIKFKARLAGRRAACGLPDRATSSFPHACATKKESGTKFLTLIFVVSRKL
jgi:hypothetical protein